MLSLDVPPQKLAMASALGILVGFSPYIGLHTYIAIGFSSLFRLPLYPLLIGAYITNPITIPFIYSLTTKFGLWLLNIHVQIDTNWSEINIRTLLSAGKALLVPFIVGSHVAGLILSFFTYFIVYYIVKRYRKNSPPIATLHSKSNETLSENEPPEITDENKE